MDTGDARDIRRRPRDPVKRAVWDMLVEMFEVLGNQDRRTAHINASAETVERSDEVLKALRRYRVPGVRYRLFLYGDPQASEYLFYAVAGPVARRVLKVLSVTQAGVELLPFEDE